MGKYLSKHFQDKEGYHLGEAPKDRTYIKINANESPYPPSPAVLSALTKELVTTQNLYADPKSTELTKTIAAYYHVKPEQVFADSGSDVILAYCMIAFGSGNGGFCFPDVTYNFYKTFSIFFGLQYREIPLKKDFSICADDYCSCGCNVLIANPNAPSGLKLDLADVKRIAATNSAHLVIIDEAYVDYGNESCVPLINQYDNLLIIQTMSKSRNLAGARIGFAVSSAQNIADLFQMKAAFNPDSINSISQALGCAAVRDVDYMHQCVSKIIRTREKVRAALLQRGFHVLESNTNFLFFEPTALSAEALYSALKQEGVLVRYYDQPRIQTYIRMSIGTEEQMHTVIAKIDKILLRCCKTQTTIVSPYPSYQTRIEAN
ncbi:MAG: histidinol-phosphate transaminase [Ruminococcaceae bacterium]|jgi:histidinol-phosphate aminotransferase|nr:histidinol-phosphate transaminase [Oscillospiraceae bacterium]